MKDLISEEGRKVQPDLFDSGDLSQDECSGSSRPKAGRKRKGEDDGTDPTDVIKRRRTWELWSTRDKHIFFEALSEYGKDFDKIQAHFQNKFKNKKNFPEHYIKNKNQIRHFYYRSWHKISPFLIFDKDLKKSTKELFGLINYGELWKKVGGTIGDKLGVKLDELVQKGSATFKHKGKTFRVKTPVCRALKRIHNKGDTAGKQKGTKLLPSKIIVDLRPRDTRDWCKVQRLAQNPHVKVSLGPQRKVASVLRCLAAKWRSRETKLLESLPRGEDSPAKVAEELVLFPPKDAKINLPLITLAPVITSSQISLQSMKPDNPGKDGKVKVKFKFSEDETLVTEVNGNLDSTRFNLTPDCDKLFDQQGSQEENDPGEDYLLEDSEGLLSAKKFGSLFCQMY